MANPLTKEDKAKIVEALKAITEVKKDIAKAKLAGINVDVQEKRLLDIETRLRNIKQVYFPT